MAAFSSKVPTSLYTAHVVIYTVSVKRILHVQGVTEMISQTETVVSKLKLGGANFSRNTCSRIPPIFRYKKKTRILRNDMKSSNMMLTSF